MVNDLVRVAKKDAPGEICGFVCVRKGDVGPRWRVVQATNTATENLEFAMDPKETIELFEKYGSDIVGLFHSHPQGSHRPSQTDVDYAPIGLRYWIVTLDQVIEWDMCCDGAPVKLSTQTRSS